MLKCALWSHEVLCNPLGLEKEKERDPTDKFLTQEISMVTIPQNSPSTVTRVKRGALPPYEVPIK